MTGKGNIKKVSFYLGVGIMKGKHEGTRNSIEPTPRGHGEGQKVGRITSKKSVPHKKRGEAGGARALRKKGENVHCRHPRHRRAEVAEGARKE